jgi:hypothetical protein
MSLRLQCVDCGELFENEDEVNAHLVPGECSEWENHQMCEVTFRIYTDEMEARDRAIAESWTRWYSKEACQARALAMNTVIGSGHLEMTEPELIDHLINDHEYGEGARARWDLDTQSMMHWYRHLEEIETEWWANDRASHPIK